VKKKIEKKKNILKYITERWTLFLFSGIVLYFLFGIVFRGNLKNYLLNKNPEITKAVIINEENYWGNSPVSKTFSYSYEFIVGEKKYREDSRNKKLKIGDSIFIEYVSSYPSFSRIKKEK
jgi:hypothetical protein